MFEFAPNSLPPFERPRPQTDHAALLNQSIGLFYRARRNAAFEKIKRAFFGGRNALFDLEEIPSGAIRSRRYGGIKPVGIDSIRGSLGRSRDFDARFYPLDDRMRDRWASIAVARSHNIPLKPVDLIQVGGAYFVRDGHHRISVARALGETMVDAEVTIWDARGPLPWEEAPRAICELPAASD